MKGIFCLMIALIDGMTIYAQQAKDEYKQLIDSAINIRYLDYKKAKQNNKYYYNNLYLINEQNRMIDDLPSSKRFKLINVYDKHSRKTIRKGIYTWKVITQLNTNHLIVTILDFYITYNNHNYNFANGGGSEAIFDYKCDLNDWVLLSFVNKGI